MKNAMQELLRIESSDLGVTEILPNSVPMRLGTQIAGRARICREGDRSILDLGDGRKQNVITKRFTFPEHIQSCYCLLCGKCKKWRKRLFLNDVSFGPLSRAFTHSFECKECIASGEAKKSKRGKDAWRRGDKKRSMQGASK
jgi:hypothetical protein